MNGYSLSPALGLYEKQQGRGLVLCLSGDTCMFIGIDETAPLPQSGAYLTKPSAVFTDLKYMSWQSFTEIDVNLV